MSDQLDKLLCEVQAEKEAREREKEELRHELEVDGKTKEQILEERRAKVASFQLNLDLPDDEPTPAPVQEEQTAAEEATDQPQDAAPEEETAESESAGIGLFMEEDGEPEEEDTKSAGKNPADKKKSKKKRAKGNWGCAKGLLYVTLVLALSGVLAYYAIVGVIDLLGLNKSSQTVSVEIPTGSTTKDIAEILHEEGLIDQPLIFRIYSRLTGADGNYQPHKQLELSPDMGYGGLIDELCAEQKREEVTVTIPEGYTIQEIAALLESKNVCTQDEFFEALVNNDYSDYDFLADQPDVEDDEKYTHRVYDLEGYLFPDTYNFYTFSSAYSVICKMLDNFDYRLNTTMRTTLKANGMSIDDAVILASIIQHEANNSVDMAKVSRVLLNRLKAPDKYPRLQCDTTMNYIIKLLGTDEETEVRKAYDTYFCEGLPVGAICNPGLDALNAVVQPYAGKDVANCYFFATDLKTGINYYSRTYNEHVAICKKYGIGVHG